VVLSGAITNCDDSRDTAAACAISRLCNASDTSGSTAGRKHSAAA